MITVQRYYLKDFLRLFVILSLGLSTIASLFELINRIDDFMPYSPSIGNLIQYSLLVVPNYFLYVMPVSVLLSSLFIMGSASRRKETVAIRSSGGSIKKMLRVFIYTGIVMTILSLIVSEFVSPPAMREAHRLKNLLSKRGEIPTFKEGTIWIRSRDAIVKIELYSKDNDILKGLSIFRMEGDMLLERIEADYAEWRPKLDGGETGGGVWYLRNGVSYNIKSGETRRFSELQTDHIEPPRAFKDVMRKPEEMNLRELMNYTRRLKEAGFRNNTLVVDIQSRVAYPIINLIMMLLGLSLATSGEMRSGLITAAFGIGISLIYWLSLSLSLSLSYTGIIPTFAGPWLTPFLFGLFSIYRFNRIPE